LREFGERHRVAVRILDPRRSKAAASVACDLPALSGEDIDEDLGGVSAGIAHAALLLLAAPQPELMPVEALCPVEVGG
jgi:hypothetical protein